MQLKVLNTATEASLTASEVYLMIIKLAFDDVMMSSNVIKEYLEVVKESSEVVKYTSAVVKRTFFIIRYAFDCIKCTSEAVNDTSVVVFYSLRVGSHLSHQIRVKRSKSEAVRSNPIGWFAI